MKIKKSFPKIIRESFVKSKTNNKEKSIIEPYINKSNCSSN